MFGHHHAIKVIKFDEIRIFKYKLGEKSSADCVSLFQRIDHDITTYHLSHAHQLYNRSDQQRVVKRVKLDTFYYFRPSFVQNADFLLV